MEEERKKGEKEGQEQKEISLKTKKERKEVSKDNRYIDNEEIR